MKKYFQLQYKIVNRKIVDFGLPLFIGYTFLPLVFMFLSNYLFKNRAYANYIYVFIALSIVLKLSEPKRNDFLKSIFSKDNYKKIRILENIIICLPFTLFLIYQKQLIFSIILNICSVILILFNISTNLNATIPTPFSKQPFEFTVGFRKTFYAFPVAYFLTYISISVENFNLGVVSMLLIGLTCFSYYSKTENEYFVWNYNLSSREFLIAKIKICLCYFSFLSLPIIIALSITFFNQINTLIIAVFLCYAYLSTIVLAKYTTYPNSMHLPQIILFALTFIFPPMLLILIPLFYSQSIEKLNTVLND